MKIPFFEILALVFLLWPLIQKFLKKNQPETGQPDEYNEHGYYDGAASEAPSHEPVKGDWEHAMRELEMIFTGETPPERRPVEIRQPEPTLVRETSVADKKIESDSRSFYAQNQQKKAQQDSEFMSHERENKLEVSGSTIYKSLDEAVEIDDSDTPTYSIFTDVKDGKKLREFYVMKEVLGKPRSLRKNVRNNI